MTDPNHLMIMIPQVGGGYHCSCIECEREMTITPDRHFEISVPGDPTAMHYGNIGGVDIIRVDVDGDQTLYPGV